MPEPIVIVGAGVAGLTAARTLVAAGHAVRLVDKGRSVGGRLATRRIVGATVDHGAQFFTVRSEGFATTVAQAARTGIVFEWCRGFDDRADGHPRYAIRGGMNRLAKQLAEGLDVRVDTRIRAVRLRGDGWELDHDDGTLSASAVILTAPVPQALDVLDAGGVALDPDVRARLDEVVYHPTLALLVVLDGPSSVPRPGGIQLEEGPFAFVADNARKGISDRPAVTLHLSHELSAARWDDDPAALQAELLEWARPWLGDSRVVAAQLKHWRYAQPVHPHDDEIVAAPVDGAPLVFAGDAFAGAKVEGAYRSGHAAAAHLTDVLLGAGR